VDDGDADGRSVFLGSYAKMKLKQLVDGTWSVRRSEAGDSEIVISTAGSSPGSSSKS
jgi:hypothetical protein